MTTQIAIIDPFIKVPAVNCFNGLVNLLKIPASYHLPSLMGLKSLQEEREKNAGYIVLGSASHVHENLSWQKELGTFLIEELNNKKPVLGCCFGHQLMAHYLGSEVQFHSLDESKLSGVRPVTVLEDFWNFEQDEVFNLGVTHRQVVKKLGPNLKAVGFGIENDIIIHDTLPFLGTQAHPEASYHFCFNDIQNMREEEMALAQRDGGKLIKRFFEYFQIIPTR